MVVVLVSACLLVSQMHVTILKSEFVKARFSRAWKQRPVLRTVGLGTSEVSLYLCLLLLYVSPSLSGLQPTPHGLALLCDMKIANPDHRPIEQ